MLAYARIPYKATFFATAGLVLVLLTWLLPQDVGSQSAGTPQFLPVIVNEYPTPTPTPLPGYVLLTEVMIDPSGMEPDGEWIELFNPGSTLVDLSIYKLGDEEAMGGMEGMHIFPPGSTLPAGEVIVVANRASIFFGIYGEYPDYELHDSLPTTPNLAKYSAWSGGNMELVNGGDEVILLDGENLVSDGLSWGSSRVVLDPPAKVVATDHSLERIPAYRDTDSAADWIDLQHPTPGIVDITPPTPTPTLTPEVTGIPTGTYSLLISEVLYYPSEAPGVEWIEIYNFGDTGITLAGVHLGDEETPGGGEGMLIFPSDASIASGEVVVVANNGANFLEYYGFNADFEMADNNAGMPVMLRDLAWGSGQVLLANSGDEVLLLSPDGTLLDGLSWGTSDLVLDPPAPVVRPGSSLERYPPDVDTDAASDWREQIEPAPGEVDLVLPTPTPTATPTPSPTLPPVLVVNEIHADPDLTLGDANGDGVIGDHDDEFVEIVNITGSPVDLSGWTLGDGIGPRHVFPANNLIPDQCAVLIFGGGQPQGAFGGSVVQVASSGGLQLNNTGDSIYLADPSGTQVITFTYGTEADDRQSIVRSPDITGPESFIKHSTAPGANGALFSPGTRIDGSSFSGCSALFEIWIRKPVPAPGGSP
jgi:hypothetical protein